uniref:Retroviral polymerase SH3-like domain-containing protein n=1 Tax=Tanacetum cinerariifolium TaxID=118510 RepID=A0A6L2N144_TANCI|nr:hypothetical protein [Tanacetum cinerariifolium]
MYRESNLKCIKTLDKELENLKQEKDMVDGKLARLLKSLKDIESLIESQRSDKKDLSWTGLPEFVDDIVTDYSRPSPTVASTSAEGQNKNSSTFEDVASPNIPKPFVKFVKPKDSQSKNNLGKFKAKGDEGYFIGYSMSSKAFKVFNKRTRRVEENLHVEFLENKAIEKGIKDAANQEVKKDVSSLRYIVLPNWAHDALLETSSTDQMKTLTVESPIPTVSSPVPTACLNDSLKPSSEARLISKRVTNQEETSSLDNILSLINRFEDILGVTTSSDEAIRVEADVSNMETTISTSLTPSLIIHKDHPKSEIIGPVDTPIQTRHKSKEVEEQSFIATIHQKTDPALLQFCLFSCFLSQVEPKKPLGFQDPAFLAKVYKVEKAMYGLHQAPRAWQKEDFILVQVYVDDIIFGSSNPQLYREFEALMHQKFQMSVMDVRSLNTPMDKEKPWGKDGTGKDVDLHLYRSMIGSLMYLTASRPDIMFAVYEPASPVRDVSEGEACPTESGFIAKQDRETIGKSSTLPHDLALRVTSPTADEGSMQQTISELTALCTSLQRQHSELLDKFQAQEVEILSLKERVQVLEDRESVAAKQSRDDAPIKGRRINEGEAAAERINNDSEEIARWFHSHCWSPATVISTGSEVGPIASLIVTSYSRRKGKEVIVESDTPMKQRLQEQIDAQVARELKEQQEKEDMRMNEQMARDAEVARIYSQQIRPMTKKQKRDYYMAMIRNNLGWKAKDFKGMTFEEIEAKFAEVWKQVEDFIPMGSKKEAERLKRKGLDLEQEHVKKQKLSEEALEIEKSTEGMQLVPVEDVYVQALQVKHPIIDWKVHAEGQKSYWKIIRLGGNSACYQFFIDLLK